MGDRSRSGVKAMGGGVSGAKDMGVAVPSLGVGGGCVGMSWTLGVNRAMLVLSGTLDHSG